MIRQLIILWAWMQVILGSCAGVPKGLLPGESLIVDERGQELRCVPLQSPRRSAVRGRPAAMPGLQLAAVQILRYFSAQDRDYLYTQDVRELGLEPPASSRFQYQMIAFRLHQIAMRGLVPVFRYYSPVHKDHFYSVDESEIGEGLPVGAFGKYGYRRERNLGYIAKNPARGLVAVYRFYEPLSTSHFYTTQFRDVMGLDAQKDALVIGAKGKNGYIYEGILGYAHPA